ncbi:MAG: amidohydrolase family protein [Flavobacteriales bacterium]
MRDIPHEGKISLERVVEKMAHAPAILFRIQDRGFLREGYHADIVLVDPSRQTTVFKENCLSKCAWSPFEGHTFHHAIDRTFINGRLAYSKGEILEGKMGDRLLFNID